MWFGAKYKQTTYLPRFLKVDRENDISVFTHSWYILLVRVLYDIVKLIYLANPPPERSTQFLLMTDDLVLRRLWRWWARIVKKDVAKGNSQSSRSTSGPRFILPVHVWKISRRSRRDGRGNSIFRSKRPGRSKAGSRVSARLVAIMTWINASY